MSGDVHLPPGPRWPVALQGMGYIAARRRLMGVLHKRYARGERLRNRGVAFAPSSGGSALVYRRARGYAVASARSNSVGSCAQTMSKSDSPRP